MEEKKIKEKELDRVSGGFSRGKNYVFCAGDRFIDGNCGRIYFIEENITISDLGKLLTCIIIDPLENRTYRISISADKLVLDYRYEGRDLKGMEAAKKDITI